MKIAISGLSGSGNTTACKKIARFLHLTPINYTLRDLAAELGMGFLEIHEKRKIDPSYDFLLDRRLIEAFGKESNAIIGSRLAIWLVDANLRVWLDAPLGVRAGRIAERDGITRAEAVKITRKRDEENRSQYRKLYSIDIARHAFADMVVDSEKLDANEVARRIALEAKKAKYGALRKSIHSEGIWKKIGMGIGAHRC